MKGLQMIVKMGSAIEISRQQTCTVQGQWLNDLDSYKSLVGKFSMGLSYSTVTKWAGYRTNDLELEQTGPGPVELLVIVGDPWNRPLSLLLDWLTWPNTTIHLEGDFYHAPHNHSQFTKKCLAVRVNCQKLLWSFKMIVDFSSPCSCCHE